MVCHHCVCAFCVCAGLSLAWNHELTLVSFLLLTHSLTMNSLRVFSLTQGLFSLGVSGLAPTLCLRPLLTPRCSCSHSLTSLGSHTLSTAPSHTQVFLLSLLDLPFSISPVVTGLMLTLLYGRNGWFGPLLQQAGINVVFAFAGACVCVCVSCCLCSCCLWLVFAFAGA